MNIPRVNQPERYAGLFIYDFGDHVSVGYTAEEIDVLTRSELHKSGSAYQIYRVTDGGAMELRGKREEITESDAERVLNAVLDSGITFIDTSPDYGLSEERIGVPSTG